MATFKPTVFVSYTYADRQHPLLRRLVRHLRSVGASVWRDQEEIRWRSPLFEQIQTAVARADYFLYIVSHGTAESRWSRSELHLAYADQLRKQKMTIVPVRIDRDIPAPEFLAGLPIVDLADDPARGLKTLTDLLLPPSGELIVQFPLDVATAAPPIIDVTSSINSRLIEHFVLHPEELKSIDRRHFEEIVAELFHGFGYEVELTAKTRDGGRDVIAIGGNAVVGKYLIECKRPDPGHAVGIRPVRELFGVKTDEGATKAILATTAHFSPAALLFFERHRWELEPREFAGLMEWLHEYLSRKGQKAG